MPHVEELTAGWRTLIPVLATALLVAGWAFRRSRAARVAVTAALVVLAGMSTLRYTASHIDHKSYTNYYAMFHYYLPMRYSQELGYTGMYDATVAARDEIGAKKLPRVRDLRSGELVSYEHSLARGKKLKKKFSPERWSAWVEDIRFFSHKSSLRIWKKLVTDRGYNGTPPWTVVGRYFANQVRPQDPHGLMPLALLDVGWWAVALGAVTWAFGLRALLVLIIVLGSQFVTSFTPLKASFLRVDWICSLLVAMALEKRGRSALAGAMVAWAGLSRLFPVVFAFGPAVVLVQSLILHRRPDRRALRFLISFGLTMVLGAAFSLWATSVPYWEGFLRKIAQLGSTWSAWRVGFPYLWAGSWDGLGWGGQPLPNFYADHTALAMVGKVLGLVIAATLALRQKEPWERLIVGYILMFFLVGSVYYYYVVLLVPALWLSTRQDDGRAVAVLAMMFLGSVVQYLAWDRWDRSYPTFYVVSLTQLLLILGLLWTGSRPPRPAMSPPDP